MDEKVRCRGLNQHDKRSCQLSGGGPEFTEGVTNIWFLSVTSLTSSCIVMYVGMACISRNDDASFTSSRRVNKRITLNYTIQEADQFLRKISGSMFTWFACFEIHVHVGIACIIAYSQGRSSSHSHKGLTEK